MLPGTARPRAALSPSPKQLVRENTEAVDRGGLGAEDDGAEGDRAAAVALGEIDLGRREVALGADEDEDALRTPGAVLGEEAGYAAVFVGVWLMAEAGRESGEDLELVPAAVAALVDAAHDAGALMLEARDAIVDLPALPIDEERVVPFRRAIDAATMGAAMRLLDRIEREEA